MLGGHSFAAPQNYGEQQFFIAKFDHCGELVWVNYSDGFGYDCLNGDIQLAIEVGPSGDEINLHVALSLENTIPGANYELFNDQVLNNSNNTYNPILFESTLSDLLGLLKLRSSDGALLWDQTIANYSYTNTQLNDLAFANGALSIAGKINDQATVREIDLTSFSFNMPYTLVDNNTHNVISDIDFASNGDLFAIGQMTNTIDFGAGSMSPANTSDVFILKSNASGIVMNQLEVSEEANAVGIEVLANGRIAIAGNYRGDISSYIIPSYGSPSNMSGNTDAAFIADLDPNNLSINWLESSDHANTLPNTANNIESSVCAGISSNANSEVMVYGQFKGDNFWFTTGYQSSSMQLNAMGSQIPTSESIWTIKLSGFGSSNCNPHWANTLTEIEDLKTVAIAAGAQNHYIIGDFINNMNVAQWSFSSPNPASYVLRFGDVYDPNMGQFYKNENLEDELLEVNSLSIYPNPTHHELNIQWEQADELITIQIIDLTGRIVYSSENIDGKQALATISTENFDSGSYFVRLSSKEGIQEKPFIKL